MVNTCIFSGSFNPVHNGHLSLAMHIIGHCGFDELWFLVSPENPLKQGLYTVSAAERYNMLKIAVKGIDGVCASDYELHLPTPTYTCQTLRSLSADYPNRRFALLVGADNMAVFDKWKEHRFILDNYRVVVYPRPGVDIGALKARYPSMETIDGAPLFNVSGTMIRQRIAQGMSCRGLLDPKVESYIRRKGLYGCKPLKLDISR